MKVIWTMLISGFLSQIGALELEAAIFKASTCRSAIRTLTLGTIDIGHHFSSSAKPPRLAFENIYYPLNSGHRLPGYFGPSHPEAAVWNLPDLSPERLEETLTNTLKVILEDSRIFDGFNVQKVLRQLKTSTKIFTQSTRDYNWMNIVDLSILGSHKNFDTTICIRRMHEGIQIQVSQTKRISPELLSMLTNFAMKEIKPVLMGYQWTHSIPDEKRVESPETLLASLMEKALLALHIPVTEKMDQKFKTDILDQIAEGSMRELFNSVIKNNTPPESESNQKLISMLKRRWRIMNNHGARIKNIGELKKLIEDIELPMQDWISLGLLKRKWIKSISKSRQYGTEEILDHSARLKLSVLINNFQELTIATDIRIRDSNRITIRPTLTVNIDRIDRDALSFDSTLTRFIAFNIYQSLNSIADR